MIGVLVLESLIYPVCGCLERFSVRHGGFHRDVEIIDLWNMDVATEYSFSSGQIMEV